MTLINTAVPTPTLTFCSLPRRFTPILCIPLGHGHTHIILTYLLTHPDLLGQKPVHTTSLQAQFACTVNSHQQLWVPSTHTATLKHPLTYLVKRWYWCIHMTLQAQQLILTNNCEYPRLTLPLWNTHWPTWSDVDIGVYIWHCKPNLLAPWFSPTTVSTLDSPCHFETHTDLLGQTTLVYTHDIASLTYLHHDSHQQLWVPSTHPATLKHTLTFIISPRHTWRRPPLQAPPACSMMLH